MDRDIEGKPTADLPLGREGRRAVPQGRQGPRRREGRRAAHEADAGPRRAARRRRSPRTSSAPRCARSSSRRTRAASRPSWSSSSRSASRSSPRASCRSSSPKSTSRRPNKAQAEELLKAAITQGSSTRCQPDQQVMLKLTIPDKDNLYADLIKHPNVLRVVALSGGYSRDEANKRLARNHGMIASFSRALAEGLTAQQIRQGVQRARWTRRSRASTAHRSPRRRTFASLAWARGNRSRPSTTMNNARSSTR